MTRSIDAQPTRNYFTDEELQCRCPSCEAARDAGFVTGLYATRVRPDFLRHLNLLREQWYCTAMPVSSGFRCLAHPLEAKKVRRAEEQGKAFVAGDHPSGVGVDIRVAGEAALALIEAAAAYNWAHLLLGRPRPFTAISPHQRGPWDKRFVHLGGNSTATGRPRPTIWTY